MHFKKLDNVFSKYVRLKEADEFGNVKCCTCPTIEHWKEMDCGHFMPRGNFSVRWNEFNCHPQCKICNQINNGEPIKYEKFINNTYGANAADIMRQQARKVRKFTQGEIDELIKYYQDKIKELYNPSKLLK